MGTCFVIQPFDKGPFDKRFDDVIAPAIRDAGLEPYRVDRDPGTTIVIEQIELGIRNADICLADISSDNPNVWYELGYAFAAEKDVVLVCAQIPDRRFPFDVQHRSLILYQTESPSDFDRMKALVTAKIKALLSKERTIQKAAMSPLAMIEGLEQHEIVVLVTIAGNLDVPEGSVSHWFVRQDMEKAGYTKVALTLGLAALLNKAMIRSSVVTDQNGEPYASFCLTEKGMSWLLQNQDKLVLKKNPHVPMADLEEIPF